MKKLKNKIIDLKKETIQKQIELFDDFEQIKKRYSMSYLTDYISCQLKKRISNEMYNFKLIDLAAYLNIYSPEIVKNIIRILRSPSNYLVKLSALDYLMVVKRKINVHSGLVKALEMVTVERNYLVVKNQALINLIDMMGRDNEEYKRKLLVNLARTKDYRSHIRTYNNIIGSSLEKKMGKEYIHKLVEVSVRKVPVRSVKEKIKQLEV